MSILTSFARELASSQGVVTSLEDFAAIEENSEEIGSTIEGALSSPSASLVEVNEAVSDVQSLADDSEQLQEDVETLESMQLVLQKSLDENNGLNDISFEFYHINMTRIYKKYGIKSQDVVPSLESFQEDRETNTRVSMEAGDGVVSRMIDAIKRVLTAIWTAIKNFFSKIYNFIFGTKKKAQETIKELDKLDESAEADIAEDIAEQVEEAKALTDDAVESLEVVAEVAEEIVAEVKKEKPYKLSVVKQKTNARVRSVKGRSNRYTKRKVDVRDNGEATISTVISAVVVAPGKDKDGNFIPGTELTPKQAHEARTKVQKKDVKYVKDLAKEVVNNADFQAGKAVTQAKDAADASLKKLEKALSGSDLDKEVLSEISAAANTLNQINNDAVKCLSGAAKVNHNVLRQITAYGGQVKGAILANAGGRANYQQHNKQGYKGGR